MKKIGFIVFLGAIVIGVAFSSFFSFGTATGRVFNFSLSKRVTGSGNITTEAREASGFSSVEVGGIFQVEIVAQKDFGVQVVADDNLLEFIKTEVRGDVLTIETDKKINSKSPIRVLISAPNIERIEASGASKVSIADLNNSSLDIDTSGASKVSVAGETGRLNVDVSGASNIDAASLKAANASVEASGASKVSVFAVETLRTDASGASRVTYSGNPTSLQKNVSGASSINQK